VTIKIVFSLVKQVFTKVYSILRSVNTIDLAIKIGIVVALLVVGFFVEAFVLVAAALILVFMILENNFKSFLYIVFLFPFGVALHYMPNGFFKDLLLELDLGPVEMFYVIMVFFTTVHFVKHLIKIRFRIHKDWFLISILVFLLYLVPAQFIGRADFSSVAIFAYLLFLFFLCVKNLDKLKLKDIAFFLTAGIFVASLLALFAGVVPKLSSSIPEYSGGLSSETRFSGLMANPNSFYTLCLGALVMIFVLSIRNQMNIYLFGGCFALLTVIGISTMSRMFIVAFFPLVIFFVVLKLWKVVRTGRVQLKKILLLFAIVATILVAACFTPQFQTVFERLLTQSDRHEDFIDPGRLGLWELYLKNWSASPKTIIFGIGLASPISPEGIAVIAVHSAPLLLLTQTGIVGLVLFALVLVCAFRSVCATKIFKLECLLPAIAVVCFSLVETALLRFQFYFFLVLIMLCMQPRSETNKNDTTSI